jgi:hypothetical protein
MSKASAEYPSLHTLAAARQIAHEDKATQIRCASSDVIALHIDATGRR